MAVHNAHATSHPDSAGTSRIRTVFGGILGVVAILMTPYLGWVVYDAITSDYVGGEVDAVRAIIGLITVLTVLAWVGAVALTKTGRDRSRHSLMLNAGLWIVLAGAVGVYALSLTPLWVVALGIVAAGLIMAVVGVARL
jgi:hypothetical protein